MLLTLKNVLHPFWQHKYFFTFIFFLITAGFVGKNSFYSAYSLVQENKELRKEIANYEANIANYRKQEKQLDNNPEAIEEIARITWKMKKEDEDIYIIETNPSTTNTSQPIHSNQ